MQQVLDAAVAHGRKVGYVGRSMVRNMGIAQGLGYLHVPPDVMVDAKDLADANNFYLTSSLAVSSFCLPGQTANQCATGNGAFSLGAGNSVYDQLLNMSAAQAAAR